MIIPYNLRGCFAPLHTQLSGEVENFVVRPDDFKLRDSYSQKNEQTINNRKNERTNKSQRKRKQNPI